jgi:Ca2+-binding EF-hand superfamily protein
MDNTSALLNLFSAVPMSDLQENFPSSDKDGTTQGITMREFAKWIKKLEMKKLEAGAPASPTGRLSPTNASLSPSKMSASELNNVIQLFKQVDTSGDGTIKFSDFTSCECERRSAKRIRGTY